MSTPTGQPRTWLRLEGLAAFVVSLFFYKTQLGSWGTFAVLFLVPDLSMVGYVAGSTVGARMYNLAHNEVAPLFLIVYSLTVGRADIVAYGLIWTAHIGLDRALGMGLKYPDDFRSTHLGRIGTTPQKRRVTL
jgi:hypothetical protein